MGLAAIKVLADQHVLLTGYQPPWALPKLRPRSHTILEKHALIAHNDRVDWIGAKHTRGGLIELERITVSGQYSSMGEQQGEAFRDRIQAFVDMRLTAVHTYSQERGLPSADGILEIGQASLDLFRRWDPDGWAEHEGIARGAGIDSVALYTATTMTDMRDALLLAQGVETPTPILKDVARSSCRAPSLRTGTRSPVRRGT